MTDNEILAILKVDLQLSTDAIDDYLSSLIAAAKSYITTEGIHLTDSVGDGQLVVMYAAYMYRKRREANAQMPRMLRWALNNRLFSKREADGNG